MKAIWEVDDGYAGKSRPQSTEIDEDWIKNSDNEDDAMEMIEQEVQEDFNDKIRWYFSNHEELVEEVRKILSDKEE